MHRPSQVIFQRTWILRLIAAAALLLLAACGGGATSDPADVVLRFMDAKAKANADTIRSLICSEMESAWEQQAASFGSVEARLDGASCARVGESEVVACAGSIVAVYGTETTSFPLTSYRVVQEDGEWKWCGEAP
ncbi:MAG: hypothetical protein JNL42_19950 [Anaerolineae bacterium]|nr:hypothetical protein [Anaerolineae bacterium]